MTDLAHASHRLAAAQQDVEHVQDDNLRLAEIIGWLEDATACADRLDRYRRGGWLGDRDTVLAVSGDEVSIDALGKDAAADALEDRDRMIKALRKASKRAARS